ncbi:MAG: ABC transporter substrate-binding protein [Candidatus Dormibacteria bacterium]
MILGGAAALTISFRSAASHQDYVEALIAPVGPSALSPLLNPTDPVAQTVGALTGRGLMQALPGGAPRLGLATSWRSLDGGTRYRFTLSRSRRWSSGHPITTKDVAFTLAVLQSSKFPNSDIAAPWTGVSLYASSLWAGTFVLPGPSTSFATAAEAPLLPAAHYHSDPGQFFRGDQHTIALFPPSAGPFRVVANTPDQISLSRNPDFRPRPVLSAFTLQLEPSAGAIDALFAKGSVDGWLAATPSDLRGLPDGLLRSRITTYDFVELLMNEQAAPLDQLAVREAIAATVNRHSLLKADLARLGDPQYGPLPDSIPWAGSYAYRPGAAGSPGTILKEAGWRRSGTSHLWEKDGRPLRLTLDVPDLDPLPTAASGVASQLARKGFLVKVKALPSSGFVSGTLSQERFQVALVGFDNGPDPDLTALWGSGVEPGQSLNFSESPPDPFLNHALAQLATAATEPTRESAYLEVAKRLHLDLPAVFLYTPVDVYVHLNSVHAPGAATRGDPTQCFRQVAKWSL